MPAASLRPSSSRLGSRLRRLAPLALGIALGLGSAVSARAQSLLELYESARAYDATYLSARALAESQEHVLAQRRALMRPSASANANVGRTLTDPPNTSRTTSGSSGANIAARQPLFNRVNSVTIEQAERAYAISRFDLEAAEQDLIVRVSQAYFDVLAAQDVLATAGANKTAINEQLASAKRNFEVGTATITDTREAQARHDLALATEIAAENDLRNKRIFLEQLVGKPGVQPRPLVAPVALPPLPSQSVDEWVSRADQQHPTVRRAQLGLETAQLETEKARARRLPVLDATASVGTSHLSSSNVNQALPPDLRPSAGNTHSGSVGLQVSMPLFAGFEIQNRIKETLVLERKAREDLEAARRAVATATRQTFFGVQSGQAQVRALEAAESSSQLALEATQLGYKVGVRVNLDVLNAQTQLFTARRDLAKARYDVLMNNLRLRQSSGQLNPVDVANINSMFAR
jgi:outer membrane protein